MIANIDENVGRLRSFLDDEGLTESTIFIFTTDNGTSSGAKVHNAGMRGQKGSEYDGGHRVPFFLHWPQGGYTGGRDVQPITAHVDVVPTLIDLCGIASPADVKFDGRSLLPLLDSAANGRDIKWPGRVLVTDSQRVKDPIKWRKSAVMTDRWRLINGKELYDIKADPGQKRNIASEHSEIVGRMTAFYNLWWAELEPTFSQDCAIYLGHPAENPAVLTCHDWITTSLTPWNHGHIRDAMAGEENTGFWNVKIVEDGDYEIRIRRWPQEADAAIDAGLSAGADVPGVKAYRSRPGKPFAAVKARLAIGDQSSSKLIDDGAKEVVFEMKLKAGVTHMSSRFINAAGDEIGGYYTYVKKL
jgi:arylsulfatase B